ncbi:MAG TPA: hypothetical protein VKK79_17065 [Candidatus Lokiarchaeia archaeon]|nr:hypothetical protein [Candidatus Lokiarchaeia archaeon]
MSEPYPQCEFCPEKCNFRLDAQNLFEDEPDFLLHLLEILGMGDQDRFIDACIEKAKSYFKSEKPSDIVGFAYCLAVHTIQEIELSADLKQKMSRTVRLKLTRKEKDLGKTAVVKEFVKDKVEIVKEKVGAAKGRRMGTETATDNVEPGDHQDSTDIDANVQPQPKSEAESVLLQGTRDSATILSQWLKSDKKFMKDVAELQPTSPSQVRVTFNPESEGFLRDINISVDLIEDPSGASLLLDCSGALDVPYEYEIVIGRGKKGLVVASLPGKLTSESQALEALRAVNPKEQISWDRLMVTLNNDKNLLKEIGTLLFECPIKGARPNILLPVILTRSGKFTIIRLRFFATPKYLSSHIASIMETIAGDMDYLREYTAGDRAKSIASQSDFFTVKGPAVPTSFDFKYLPKDQQVSVRVCPNCHRPLPDPKAEYRRCPHCLAKLM